MEICAVSDDFYPNVGGITQHIRELSREMVNLGHSVRVINLRYTKPFVEVSTLDNYTVIQKHFSRRAAGLEVALYWRELSAILTQEYQRKPFDVIHWHDLRAGVSIQHSRAFRGPLRVFTNHSSGYLRLRKYWACRKYFQYSINHADLILCPSQELADFSRQDFKKANDVQYIPNGVNEERYVPSPKNELVLRELGLNKSHFVIFCPRRLAPKNGVYYLALALPDIVHSCPNAVLVVAGGGYPMEEEIRIRQEVERSGMEKHVRFLGDVNNDRIPALYTITDLVVIPSLMEAISLSALESMAAGKHVIATSVGGLAELFASPDRGTLIQPENPQAISRAVIHAMRTPEKSHAIGINARQYVVENFTWKHIAKRTIAAYETKLSKIATARPDFSAVALKKMRRA